MNHWSGISQHVALRDPTPTADSWFKKPEAHFEARDLRFENLGSGSLGSDTVAHLRPLWFNLLPQLLALVYLWLGYSG